MKCRESHSEWGDFRVKVKATADSTFEWREVGAQVIK